METLPYEIILMIAKCDLDVVKGLIRTSKGLRDLMKRFRKELLENFTEVIVLKNYVKYKVRGKLHREDGPAIEHTDGSKEWYRFWKFHRIDGPAREVANGNKEWWIFGELHREDGPAVEYVDGYKAWWIFGERHRENGPAIEYANGSKEWYQHGERYYP